jgi:hypothetical protein
MTVTFSPSTGRRGGEATSVGMGTESSLSLTVEYLTFLQTLHCKVCCTLKSKILLGSFPKYRLIGNYPMGITCNSFFLLYCLV